MTLVPLQDHLYVQYVELNQFQNEFRELSNKFQENEKIIQVRMEAWYLIRVLLILRMNKMVLISIVMMVVLVLMTNL